MRSRSTCEHAGAAARGAIVVSRSAAAAVGALEVQPRWLLHVGAVAAFLGALATVVALRRGGFEDDEDELFAIFAMALAAWVLAIALGSLVRALRAGYALRLDAAGVHVAGLEVVPWSAVVAVRQRVYERKGLRFRQIVFEVAPGYSGGSLRDYERYLFGPIPGLFGRRDTFVIATQMLAVDPDSLLATSRAFIEATAAKSQPGDDAFATAEEHRLSGKRRP
jgi:hypothetical protein